jgi:hypothetical protein
LPAVCHSRKAFGLSFAGESVAQELEEPRVAAKDLIEPLELDHQRLEDLTLLFGHGDPRLPGAKSRNLRLVENRLFYGCRHACFLRVSLPS